MKIMVVEDEKLLLEVIVDLLKTKGIESIPFSSGKQALEYLGAVKRKADTPDVIWLDYYLGDLTGIEFMNGMKANATIPKIPVLVVSNSASPSKIETMKKLGAEAYLLKAEHRLEDLVSMVLDLVVRKE